MGYAVDLNTLTKDRNQLYFERVHPLTPIIQKRRFLSCAQQANPKSPRLCLQFAMWALAALLSVQYQHIGDMLYQNARKRLENLELQVSSLEPTNVEQAQAWLLIAIYEFTRMHYSRGWMSIGRTCRLIQLMGLHKIDCVERMSKDAESIPRSSVETEERRRTFWMAYCLDRFIGIRNDWPIAFNELAVCIHRVSCTNMMTDLRFDRYAPAFPPLRQTSRMVKLL